MKLLQILKVLPLQSADNGAYVGQHVRKLKAKEQLAAQIDVWVNEGGSIGTMGT